MKACLSYNWQTIPSLGLHFAGLPKGGWGLSSFTCLSGSRRDRGTLFSCALRPFFVMTAVRYLFLLASSDQHDNVEREMARLWASSEIIVQRGYSRNGVVQKKEGLLHSKARIAPLRPPRFPFETWQSIVMIIPAWSIITIDPWAQLNRRLIGTCGNLQIVAASR